MRFAVRDQTYFDISRRDDAMHAAERGELASLRQLDGRAYIFDFA